MRKLKDIIRYARGENPRNMVVLSLMATRYGNFDQVGIVCRSEKECAKFISDVEKLHSISWQVPEHIIKSGEASVYVMNSNNEISVMTEEQAKRNNEHIYLVHYDRLFNF